MPATVALAVLAAAILHAGWNALLRSAPDKALENAATGLGRVVIALAVLPWLPIPAAEAWPWLIASVVVHIGYFWALAGAYRSSELSFAYPIMRGGAPLLVALVAVFALGEVLPLTESIGLALICGGIGAFALQRSGAPRVHRGALAYALGNAVIIAVYTLIDAHGVRVSGTAPGYAMWFFLLNGIVQTAIGTSLRGHAVLRYALDHGWRTMGGAAFAILAYGTALWAMTRAPVALVAALRETSVVFAAVIGALFLGERPDARRVFATLVVFAGLVFLRV